MGPLIGGFDAFQNHRDFVNEACCDDPLPPPHRDAWNELTIIHIRIHSCGGIYEPQAQVVRGFLCVFFITCQHIGLTQHLSGPEHLIEILVILPSINFWVAFTVMADVLALGIFGVDPPIGGLCHPVVQVATWWGNRFFHHCMQGPIHLFIGQTNHSGLQLIQGLSLYLASAQHEEQEDGFQNIVCF